jgi:lysozyme family protein
MSTFEVAIPTIIRHEGGYINNPHDPGGATKYGISLRWLKAQGLFGDVNGDLVVDIRDIQALTLDRAEGFYRVKWWDHYGYGRIMEQMLATKIFDMAVNLGAPKAHKIAQMALEARPDGVLGPESIKALNDVLGEALPILHRIQDLQAAYYRQLATNPRLAEFLTGWIARAYDRS